jgi:hypothetical protein
MISAREQKERLVLDLHNQGKNSREIAEIARISFGDIGRILRNAAQQKEAEQEQAREERLSSQAYKLFSVGKTPAEVAIELKIRAPLAIMFQREYWNLVQLDNLNQISNEIKHDIWYFVELYRLAKAGGFRVKQVVRLLKTANSDLPLVDCKYENLKTDVKTLEEYKRNSEGRLGDLNNQITEASNYVEYYRASCRQEQKKLEGLRQKRMKLEAVVRHFENNNEEFLKIGRIVEDRVHSTLSHSKGLLKYALLSLVESMKKDPAKYNSLIYNDIHSSTSTTVYGSQYYAAFDTHGQQQQYPSSEYYSEACIEMLVDEAEKVFNKLTKKCIDGSIADYAASKTSSLLSLQPRSDKK